MLNLNLDRKRDIFKIVLEEQILENSEFHQIEEDFPYFCKFLHNKV
jgi:hypothetical protein